MTEAPLVGAWTEAPYAKKTVLAPPTLPTETEAPLVRAGSEALQAKITGLAPPTLTLTAGSFLGQKDRSGKYINKTAQRQVSVLKTRTETCCVVL